VSEPLQLPPGEPPSRLHAIRAWLTRTFVGRAVLVGASIKLVAFLIAAVAGHSRGLDAFDSLGDISLVVAAVVLGYRVYIDAKRRLLWRVRRKLIVSYIFIGVVPALLIIAFFLVAGILFLFNVSSLMLQNRFDALVTETRFLAEKAAVELGQAQTADAVRVALNRSQAEAAARYPLASYALVPAPKRCGPERTLVAGGEATAGGWVHLTAPHSIPAWVSCMGVAGLMTANAPDGEHVFGRAVAWPEGLGAAVVVDVPFDDALAKRLHDDMGITLGVLTTSSLFDDQGNAERRTNGQTLPSKRLVVGPFQIGADQNELLQSASIINYTDWTTGEMSTLVAQFGMGPAAVFRYLSGTSSERLGNLSFGQLLLLLLAVIGVMFLIIQGVAFLMGLTLARSITGSVHELFVGTERLRRGDFSHKIAIRSRDQLGELAGSFNSMSASIQDLLEQKAEKERLEQELRIARSIQMSLLPSGSHSMRGISLEGHCEPAREVGGDYYDFLPLDHERMGILIADVAGKGTSAALYMAELKGLVLSLSQLHASPRQLLIDANRIISKHLDARSFITMTYAVVDVERRTLTVARAGHCPLVFVPGPHASSRAAQSVQPDGMVLGLALDTGDMFSRVLEEVTIPLGRGDLFLLYTDGISEAMNVEGDCFGDGRLADLASENADLTSGELRERILGEVHRFAGAAAQHDDMTMVLVKIGDL
jgi:sigma-B regulation protein RsbU (phosphoserine phosphatase)